MFGSTLASWRHLCRSRIFSVLLHECAAFPGWCSLLPERVPVDSESTWHLLQSSSKCCLSTDCRWRMVLVINAPRVHTVSIQNIIEMQLSHHLQHSADDRYGKETVCAQCKTMQQRNQLLVLTGIYHSTGCSVILGTMCNTLWQWTLFILWLGVDST